jgi:hypothetical protein
MWYSDVPLGSSVKKFLFAKVLADTATGVVVAPPVLDEPDPLDVDELVESDSPPQAVNANITAEAIPIRTQLIILFTLCREIPVRFVV